MVTQKKIFLNNSNPLINTVLKTEVHSSKECILPIVLDKDPVLAANFLTIKDSSEVLELMLNVFKGIKEGKSTYKIAEVCVMYSFSNFNWYVKFTEELIRLVLGENKSFDFPMDKCPPMNMNNKKDKYNKVYFCPPVEYYKKKVRLVKFRVRNIDPIDYYRIRYISSYFYLEDFREGFPAWYAMSDVVVYEDYNARTNNRIRIVHRNGEYSYFVAGASDNWKEITDVPLEMDYVVSALLFRN